MTNTHLGAESSPTLHLPIAIEGHTTQAPLPLFSSSPSSSTEHHLGGALLFGRGELDALNHGHPHQSAPSFLNHPHSTSFTDPTHPIPFALLTPSISPHVEPYSAPSRGSAPVQSKKLPRWESFATQMKDAARTLFQRKRMHTANKRVELLEKVLEGDKASFESCIQALFKETAASQAKVHKNEEGVGFIKESLFLFDSFKQETQKTAYSPTTAAEANQPIAPATPSRSSSSTSCATLVNASQKTPDIALCAPFEVQPTELALLRTTIAVCKGDAAFARAVLQRLHAPLYRSSLPEVQAVPPLSSSMAVAHATPATETDFETFFDASSWGKNPSVAKELMEQFTKNRVEEAALECADTLAKTNSLGLSTLLAWQCKKNVGELDLTGRSKEAALAVYLSTRDFEKLPSGQKEHAKDAHCGAIKILDAIESGKNITLEDESVTHANAATIPIKEWTAYSTRSWGYNDFSQKSDLDLAIHRILKAHTTWMDRAIALRKPAMKLKEAKRAQRDEGGLSPSAVKARVQAQWGVFKAYGSQMHPAGRDKAPYWVQRKIFFSADHAIDTRRPAYNKELNAALDHLQGVFSQQLEALKKMPESDSKERAKKTKAIADIAFAYAKTQAWRELENKGKGKFSRAHFDTVADIIETTQRQLASHPAAYDYFLENIKKYKKEFNRSWIPFLSKQDFFSVKTMKALAHTVLSDSPSAQKELDHALQKALQYSRAAPLIGEINDNETLPEPSAVSPENLAAYLQTRNRAFIVNATPGSRHATSNGNLSGFTTGPYLPTPIPFLLPSLEIAAEYGHHASAEISVKEEGFDMAWGRSRGLQAQLGGGVYYGFLRRFVPSIPGPVKPSVGASLSADIKLNIQQSHATTLHTAYQYRTDSTATIDHAQKEQEKRKERQGKALETQKLLSEVVEKTNLPPPLEELSEKRPVDSDLKDDSETLYGRRQRFLQELARACFDKPYISLSEQYTHATKLTLNVAAQNSAYMGASASANVPSLGGLVGVYVGGSLYDSSRTWKVQNGQRQQQSISKGNTSEAKISLSLGTFIPVLPIRIPSRIDPIRIKFIRRLSLVKLMDKTIWSRGKKICLEHTFDNAQSSPAPAELFIEMDRSEFTQGWFNKIDKNTRNAWEARYGSKAISTLLTSCTAEPKARWVLRERFALQAPYAQKVRLHMETLKTLQTALITLKARKNQQKITEIRDLEADITATSNRIQHIYAGSWWDPVGLEVDIVTQKSRTRGPNMIGKLQRQENEKLIERIQFLKPIEPPAFTTLQEAANTSN